MVTVMPLLPDDSSCSTPSSSADPGLDRTESLLHRALGAHPVERARLHEEVITSHLWLAESISCRYRFRGEDPDDLLQVARIGLIEACERFQPDRGTFAAFASATINGMLKRHFRDHGWTVRPPRRTQELAAEMWQQWPLLAQRMGKVPSERELAAQLGETPASVADARYAHQAYRAMSIEGARTRGSQFPTYETAEEIDRLESFLLLRDVWTQLDDGERLLLQLRFYELWSQAEIAREIGTSQMQVSRLLTRLLTKLRLLIEGPEDLTLAS